MNVDNFTLWLAVLALTSGAAVIAFILGGVRGFTRGHAAGWVDRQIEYGREDKRRRDARGQFRAMPPALRQSKDWRGRQ